MIFSKSIDNNYRDGNKIVEIDSGYYNISSISNSKVSGDLKFLNSQSKD
jgi:hypothetical protein